MIKLISGNLSGWGWAVIAFQPNNWIAGVVLIIGGFVVLFADDFRGANIRYLRTKITLEAISFAWALSRRIQMFLLCRRLYGWRRAVHEFIHGAKP